MFPNISRRGVKVLAVMAAVATALLIAAPANATTGNIDQVVLTDPGTGMTVFPTSSTGTDTPVSGTNSGPVSASIAGFGTYNCDAAAAGGNLHAGPGSSGAKDPYLTITSLDITNCSSPAGVAVDVSLNPGCNVEISADPNPGQTVDSDLTDTNVTGTMKATDSSGNPCVHVEDTVGGGLCTMDVGGSTAAAFDETTQTLTLSGSGLSVDGSSLSGLCVLAGLGGAAVTFNLGVTFHPTDSLYTGDKINFIPAI